MTSFAIVGHLARTDGDFSLNDLPGAGRMDVLCRCVNASLFLSHDLRRDADCYLVLLGGPKAPKTVLFRGGELRSLSPDERSAGALVKKALSIPCGSEFREAAPGVYVRNGGLERLFTEHAFAVLDEKGTDIRMVPAGAGGIPALGSPELFRCRGSARKRCTPVFGGAGLPACRSYDYGHLK